jgi:hypothetical protein
MWASAYLGYGMETCFKMERFRGACQCAAVAINCQSQPSKGLTYRGYNALCDRAMGIIQFVRGVLEEAIAAGPRSHLGLCVRQAIIIILCRCDHSHHDDSEFAFLCLTG